MKLVDSTEETCNLIILVNGYWVPGVLGRWIHSQYPKENYWCLPKEIQLSSNDCKSQSHSEFVKAAMEYYKAKEVCFVDSKMRFYSTAKNRIDDGHFEMEELLSQKDFSNYEQVIFISHSAGAAYAQGMIATALKAGVNVTNHLCLAPYQIKKLDFTGHPETIQVNIDQDWLSFYSGKNTAGKGVGINLLLKEKDISFLKKDLEPMIKNSNHGIIRMLPGLFKYLEQKKREH